VDISPTPLNAAMSASILADPDAAHPPPIVPEMAQLRRRDRRRLHPA